MTRRPGLRGIVLALSLLTVQAGFLIPARANAELRAVHCCATHCRHARSSHAAARCCGLQRPADQTATIKSTKGADKPQTHSVMLAVIEAGPWPAGEALVSGAARVTSRAAPVFLLTRTLRL